MTHAAQPNVLLVEDNPGDVLVVTSALKSASVASRLHVASDGREALDFVHQRGEYADAPRPRLIFLDINLPRVDGHAVLQELKNDPDLRRIPVVMLTSSDADDDVVAAYSNHANAYLLKGFDFTRLEELLQESVVYWLTRVVSADT
ncbi:response regulator [Euzebya tangerina]|uniref:response regulator n=1 Tax=Euzebya tangerina TaxID=591198 RepID=UPI000E315A3A|nr:response regulator [Euzebya tangerina]